MSLPRYVQNEVYKWDDTDVNAVVDHVRAGETVTGFLAFPYTYMVRGITGVYDAINQVGTRVYGGTTDEGGVDGANCSAVVQAVINDIYATGGSIYFPSYTYEFNTKITFPKYSHSLRLFGDCGWGKSATLNGMPIAGTIFKSNVSGDALFTNLYDNDLRSAVALNFDNIQFIGPNDAGSKALYFINLDQSVVHDCCFFDFAYAFHGYFDGSTIAEMPGMLDFHDNLVSEILTTPILMDGFMQSKIHDNEFEAWGTFTRQIHLKNTNTIQVCNNRFATGNTNTDEVVYIETTSAIYCNQIMISDNIVDMGNNAGGIPKYKFIHMDNNTGNKTASIISKDNMLHYSYIPTLATDSPYDVATDLTYGDLTASDFVYLFSDKNSNLKDLTATHTAGNWYRNLWTPVTLYFLFSSIANTKNVHVHLGKDNSGAQDVVAQTFTNNQANADTWSCKVEVPSLWWWKADVDAGCALDAVYATYR